MKKQLYNLLVGILSLVLLSATTAFADDNDSYDPPIINISQMAAVAQTTDSNLEVIFLAEAETAQVEVASDNGATVMVANGSAEVNTRVQIETRSLNKGNYLIKVKMNGKIVRQVNIQVR